MNYYETNFIDYIKSVNEFNLHEIILNKKLVKEDIQSPNLLERLNHQLNLRQHFRGF